MVYRNAPFSMTLKNPKPTFEGQAIFWRWISPSYGCRYGHSYYGSRI